MRRDVFQAIVDPTRREILSLLANEPMNLTRVAENFNISQPAISRHIKILVQCGMISIEKQGRERYCEVNVEKLGELEEWLLDFRKMWERRLDALEDFLLECDKKPIQ